MVPELESTLINPQGYAPADLAAQTTEAMQGAGGTQAAGVGQGALLEQRTKNPGSARAAIASSSRGAGEELGRRGLGVQTANAGLKEKQRAGAQSELGGVYGTQVGGTAPALGAVASNVNANTNAANQQFNQDFDWTKLGLQGAGLIAGGV